jgi:hypothetical protein
VIDPDCNHAMSRADIAFRGSNRFRFVSVPMVATFSSIVEVTIRCQGDQSPEVYSVNGCVTFEGIPIGFA